MFIEFGILNYKLLIPFIYPFFYQIRRLIHGETKPFYGIYVNFCAHLVGGLIYLIIKFRMKSKENDKNGGLQKSPTGIYNQININELEINKSKAKMQYLYIFLLSLINLIPMGIEAYTFNYININFKTGTSLFYTISFYVLFSRIILGIKVFAHQLFSIIIIISCMPVLLTFFFLNEEPKDKIKLIFNSLLLLLIMFIYSLYDVLIKKIYNKYMISPYYLMFIVGLVSLCILIPYEIITLLIFGEDNSFNGIIFQIKKYFKNHTYLYLLIFIGDVFSAFLWLAGIHLTIYFFNPCHFIISESLSQIITTIIWETLKKYHPSIKVVIYILYSIIIFASLIYNEVIIINICSLSKNTRKKIILREQMEKPPLLPIILDDKENEDENDMNDKNELININL